MGGRHRAPRVRRTPSRRAVVAAVPVVVAVAAVGTVVAVLLGSGLLAGERSTALPPGAAFLAPTLSRMGPVIELPTPDAAATAVADAARAADVRTARDRMAAPQTGGSGVCDLAGPPRFDDPDRPNVITNRDCGRIDEQGRERSLDPWVDGQLLDAQEN